MNDKLKNDIWLFLMKFFSDCCHQIPRRSFFIKGYQFPVCARCTGLYLGYIIGSFKNMFSPKMGIIFILIMAIDGISQLLKFTTSNNLRRFITGLLSGISIINLFRYIIKNLFRNIIKK